MSARIAAARRLKKRPRLPLFCSLRLLLFIFAASSLGQTTVHLPGWVVLPVDEYRTLHAKAYPIEHEPEPPPVEATLTRVDYDLRIDGELASGRASLTVDVLKDGWGACFFVCCICHKPARFVKTKINFGTACQRL